MHPETSMAKRNGPVYVPLVVPWLLDKLHRKIRRSKKLTRLLLKESPWLTLVSHTESLQHGATCVATLAPSSKLSPPGHLGCLGPPLTRLDRPDDPSEFPAVNLLRLANVKVFGHSSLLRSRSGHLFHHDLLTASTHRLSEEVHRRLQIDASCRKARIIGAPMRTVSLPRAAAFTDSVSSNYAHWLTEVLPRIALYVRAKVSEGKPLIVDADLHPNLYESLSMVLDGDRTVYLLPRDRRVFVEQLDVVTPTGYVPYSARPPKRAGHSHGVFSAEALWAVRDACRHLMTLPPEGAHKRIYVRRSSGMRKLLNDQEISDALAAEGFTVVCPEALTFSEQVRLFSQAELVIGATGAAMANLIFCPPGSRVHVLMAQHEDMPYWYWQRLADCIGVKLSYGIGDICAEHDRGFHADFSVDVAQIMAALGVFERGLTAPQHPATQLTGS